MPAPEPDPLAAAVEALDKMVRYAAAKDDLLCAYRIGSQTAGDRALTKLERLGDVPAEALAALTHLRSLRGEEFWLDRSNQLWPRLEDIDVRLRHKAERVWVLERSGDDA